MTRERDPYRIPRAGWEIAPAAGLAAIDLNGNQIHGTGTEFIGEHTVGGMLVYAIYRPSSPACGRKRCASAERSTVPLRSR